MKRTGVRQHVAPKFKQWRALIYTAVSVTLILVLGWALFVFNLGKSDDASAAPPGNFASNNTGDWVTASTWNVGSAPPTTNLSDNIFINNGNVVTRNGSLDIANGASITINGTSKLIINGNMIVKNNLTLMINGELIVNGNIEIKNGSQITVNGSGKMTASGDVSLEQNANFYVDGVVNVGGDLSFGNNANFRGNGQVNVVGNGCDNWSGPGSCNENVSLPVELASFSIKKTDNGVLVNWETATELNNDFFTIERSTNGRDYEEIAKITGSGTTNEATRYDYLDEKPMVGRSYYRLTQTDYDGTKTEFRPAVVEIESTETSTSLTVYPNPLRGSTLNVQFSRPASGVLEMLDNHGNAVLTQDVINEESKALQIENDLEPGVYYVNFKSSAGRQTVKVIKQ